MTVFVLVLYAVTSIALCPLFAKTGRAGWQGVVPIWNSVVLLKVAGRPVWWLPLLIVPLLGAALALVVMVDLARSFGRTGAFGAGLFLLPPIFVAYLGFSDDPYHGPAARVPLGRHTSVAW